MAAAAILYLTIDMSRNNTIQGMADDLSINGMQSKYYDGERPLVMRLFFSDGIKKV